MKWCVVLMLAGSCFAPHFAIAAEEEEIEIRSVMDIEGIQDFIEPDDYKDYMNDLGLNDVEDALQVLCKTNQEPSFCAAWSRFKTARIHDHAVSASLRHLLNAGKEKDKLKLLYIKDSCAEEEVPFYMAPACKALSEYAETLKEIENIQSPLKIEKNKLSALEFELKKKEEGKLKTLESQLEEAEDELEQLNSQLEAEKRWYSIFSSDEEKALMEQIKIIENNIRGMKTEIERTENNMWKIDNIIRKIQDRDDIEDEVGEKIEDNIENWALEEMKWNVTRQMAMKVACDLKHGPQDVCDFQNRIAEHQKAHERMRKEFWDAIEERDRQTELMCDNSGRSSLSSVLCGYLFDK